MGMEQYDQTGKLKRNHIFLDFEVYFTRPYEDTPEVAPFEIAAVRVQDGRIAAELHSFVTPRQESIRRSSKPLPTDKSYRKNWSPLDLDTLGLLFEVFCLGSSADLELAGERYGKILVFQQFPREFPDSIIAKDPATEREVIYHQMCCDSLGGKLVDFDLFCQTFLEKKFSSRAAEQKMHVGNKCEFHSQPRYKAHHCALGDSRYLACIFLDWAGFEGAVRSEEGVK